MQKDEKGAVRAAVGFYNRRVLCYPTKEELFLRTGNMSEKLDFSQIQKRIRKAACEAAKTGDFSGLGQAVGETMDDAADEVRRQVGRMQENLNQAGKPGTAWNEGTLQRRTPRYPRKEAAAGQKERETRTVRPRAANYLNRGGKVGGILYTVFGAIGIGVSASLSFAFFVWWLVTPHTLPLNMTALFFFLTLGFCGMLWYGCRVLGRYRLADRYMKLIGEKMYMEIEDLAARTGRSIRRVRKDVRKMLKSGMLPQGHLDPKQTTLVVNDETWEEYLKLEEQWETRRKLEEAKQGEGPGTCDPEQERIEREGQLYMERLRRLNDEIPGEAVSNKLYQLDELLSGTFALLREHPEKRSQMRKFMDYYLPTTVKLVEAYAQFDRAGVEGENIQNAKAEIEKTMDTINGAFEKLLDDLYREEAFEAAADAKVLKTVLTQDGFVQDNPFRPDSERETD